MKILKARAAGVGLRLSRKSKSIWTKFEKRLARFEVEIEKQKTKKI
jgi:hypothetical protein